MRNFTLVIIAPLIMLGTSHTFAEELVRVGLQYPLLVDDYVIAEKQNVTRELGQPKKVGNVNRFWYPAAARRACVRFHHIAM